MYCPYCGTRIVEGATYCQTCGRELPNVADSEDRPDLAAPVPPVAPEEPAQYSEPYGLVYDQPASLTYAGFWMRLLAVLIDGALLGIVSRFLFGYRGAGWLATVMLNWMYYALMESSRNQATLGKQVLGLKVVDIDGNRISFGRATGRYFAKWLSVLTLLVGFIMAGFTAKKQALHDFVAGTLVVMRDRGFASDNNITA